MYPFVWPERSSLVEPLPVTLCRERLQGAQACLGLDPGAAAALCQQRLGLYHRQAHWCAEAFVHMAARKAWATFKVRRQDACVALQSTLTGRRACMAVRPIARCTLRPRVYVCAMQSQRQRNPQAARQASAALLPRH